MKLTSPEFQDSSNIPVRYTQEGENISPVLEWSDVPEDCKSFAILCEDLDAPKKSEAGPNFTHWLIYNISGTVTFLPEGIPSNAHLQLPVLASQGENSFGEIGYSGPMPPKGSGPHRYVFTLYACRKELEVKPGGSKKQILDALQGNVLDTAQLMGRYERGRSAQYERTSSARA